MSDEVKTRSHDEIATVIFLSHQMSCMGFNVNFHIVRFWQQYLGQVLTLALMLTLMLE